MFVNPSATRFNEPSSKPAVQFLMLEAILLTLIASPTSVSSDINHFDRDWKPDSIPI